MMMHEVYSHPLTPISSFILLLHQVKVLTAQPAHVSIMTIYRLMERAPMTHPLTNSVLLTAWGDLNDLLYHFEVR